MSKENKKSKAKKPAEAEMSALDLAIANAISAPPTSRRAYSYQKSKPLNIEPSKKSKKAEKVEKTEKAEKAPKTTKKADPKPKKAEKKGKEVEEPSSKAPSVKIISLGGLNEIGKNITLIECGNDIVVIDCGMTFPDAEMPGVDIVIPDFTYLERNASKVRGVLLTHGHEDHIGGMPYLLKKLNVPVYGTKLTLGLVENKLKEHNLGKASLNVVVPSQVVKLGGFSAEFINVNHSIPGACAIAITTPAGTILHMGDFKVDYTPIEGGVIDLPRFAELGSKGVLALLSDSTNAERQGFTPSEHKVGNTFENLFNSAVGKRIIIATFSSNIHRVQQIIDCAEKHDRKVAVFGRSMVNVIKLAIDLGYLKVPSGIIIDIDKMRNFPEEKIVLITTGSQGEPMSALTRMALNDHRQVSITANDYIIISARPIPGNEKYVGRVVNELLKLGAEVVYEEMYEVHVSGHACQEEQKLILSLTRPKFFIPVHGEYKHLSAHAKTALEMGMPEKNIVIADIGNVIEIKNDKIKLNGSVPAGKVMVDGSGVGDVGAVVLRDRMHLAKDGVIIVTFAVDKKGRILLSEPEVLSRGFVYERESEELLERAKDKVLSIVNTELSGKHDFVAIKNKIKDELGDFFFSKTRRRPMIIPIISGV